MASKKLCPYIVSKNKNKKRKGYKMKYHSNAILQREVTIFRIIIFHNSAKIDFICWKIVLFVFQYIVKHFFTYWRYKKLYNVKIIEKYFNVDCVIIKCFVFTCLRNNVLFIQKQEICILNCFLIMEFLSWNCHERET